MRHRSAYEGDRRAPRSERVVRWGGYPHPRVFWLQAMSGGESSQPRLPREPVLRHALASDLPRLVELLANDPLGALRERYELPLPPPYARAFEAIDRDPNQELWVMCLEAAVVGMLQITFIPYLTYQGGWRALIEGVRIAPEVRTLGFGRTLLLAAIGRARARGCHMVQLTTDKARPEALRFYQSLGFVASHEGMKLQLPLDRAG